MQSFMLAVALSPILGLSSSVPYASQTNDDHLLVPTVSTDLPSPSEALALPGNNSLSANKLKIACDSKFGRNLKVKSCRGLFGYLKPIDDQYTFSLRGSGIPNDVSLPLRSYSSE